ncbi:Phospholipid-binding protein [Sandaracinus amylolyticus]|uniref:Phospholipid-binding protein n=2 Tax=Sandaracinus amylolyticus TaxID=927083 RepID=A0A0F6W4J9_9BACT|nr:Phospholipid-binding protein [Sandaracinus amylolyticus]
MRQEEHTMELRSDSFADGAAIPTKNAFGRFHPETHVELSENLSPHLAWSGVPEGTKSFAILCTDSEVPSRGDDVNQDGRTVPLDLPRVEFVHLALVDLPASVRELGEGALSKGVTVHGKGTLGVHGSKQGLNDYTGWFAGDPHMKGDYHGYDGPCPPWNDERLHVYTFTVLALDVASLGVEGSFTIADARDAMKGHVLAKASLTGTYAIYPKAVRAK